MKSWSLALYGPGEFRSTLESGETQFVLGTEEASDVLKIEGEGIARRHAWVWLASERMQVEALAGGTLVNGHPIEGRVEVEYPASVQVGEVTLVVEVRGELREETPVLSTEVTIPQRGTRHNEARQKATSLEVTIPQRPSANRGSSTDVTIPQRPRLYAEERRSGTQSQATSENEASLTAKYTLVREIARGGMGQIYFGEDPS